MTNKARLEITDWRTVCSELIGALDSGVPAGRIRLSPLARRARAALAESVAEGPTDEDPKLRDAALLALTTLEGWSNYDQWVWPISAMEQAKRGTTEALAALRMALSRFAPPAAAAGEVGPSEVLDWIRGIEPWATWLAPGGSLESAHFEIAQLVTDAIARYAHQPAPPAAGEVGEVIGLFRRWADAYPDGVTVDPQWLTRAADLLAQRHSAPVPVSERLPGPEDCAINPRTGQGQWCWGWVQHDPPPYSGRWRMMRREWLADEAVAWLPATALPLPQGEVE